MKTTQISLVLTAMLLGACAGQHSQPLRLASATGYCPAGTVRVCESLFEPGREIRPVPCGCADLAGKH